MPEDFLKWKATCHYNHNLIKLGDEFAALHKTQYLYMMYVWGHSYEFTDHDNWEVMENFCRRMGGREDIWYASNIEIVDYMEAAGRLQFGVGGDMVYNPSAASLWIEVDGGKREVKGDSFSGCKLCFSGPSFTLFYACAHGRVSIFFITGIACE